MFLRVIAVLLAVIGLAGVGLALISLQQRAAPPPQPVQEAAAPVAPVAPPVGMILVAARAQRAGNLMAGEDITSKPIEAGATPPPGSLTDSVAARTSLRGAMLRRSLAAGDPILTGDVLNPGDRGFLAAVLGAGMRAVTVAVDAVSGTAGLIWPGDRVDLVLTQEVENRDQPADRRVFGETVLTNLRVIAVDQQLAQGAQGSQSGLGAPNSNRTITIEANLFDAERIAVASRIGRISLVVRSAADDQQVAGAESSSSLPPAAWAGDVSPALHDSMGGGARSGNSIRLYQGPGSVDEIKF
jgi:pilus assembly protein CpaB